MCLKINYINMFDIPSSFKRVDKNDSQQCSELKTNEW